MYRVGLVLFAVAANASVVQASDWPMYRADAGRSGFTADSLPASLSLHWKYEPTHAPQPAWPRSPRQTFDRTNQPIVADGHVFFGSSADDKLYALDAETGRIEWTFVTGGPIRLAPVAWPDRVAVASDDGYLYVLAADTGALIWKHRGGPDSAMRLGNERMIGKWPARGGPVIVDGVIYYAAGIWPSDGIYLYALDAATGRLVWKNDDSGGIYMPQPHGGANANSGVSSQGHLVALENQLFMPTGRAVPAAFDRTSGKFQYFHLQKNRALGGSLTVATAGHLINSGVTFDAATGEARDKIGSGQAAAIPGGVVRAAGGKLAAFNWAEVERRDRKGKAYTTTGLKPGWTLDKVATDAQLIVAGGSAISGGQEKVDVVDLASQKVAWSAPVDGAAHGLAVADGRLLVATQQGTIYCFARANSAPPGVIRARIVEHPYGDNRAAARAADEILRQSGVTKGYCLDLGCGDGRVAYELARRSNLVIFAVDSDPEKVALARKKLDEAGLYGTRVTVHQAPLDATGYPRYFANLIVSSRTLAEGADAAPAKEVERLLRPYGGVSCLGRVGEMQVNRRGDLPGAGSWTHQYSNPANTVCSDDALIGGKLGILWFRDVDLELPQRHGRGPAPLFYKGWLLHEGLDEIRAVDAYNGRVAWSYKITGVLKAYDGDHLMGVSGTGSNYCVTDQGVYARHEDYCVRIDLATGKPLGEFKVPEGDDGKSGPWGYIATSGDTLFGTRADPQHVVTYRYRPGGDMKQQLTESNLFFALDATSGKPKWKYQAKHSIRHNAIAIGEKHVYLIDRPAAQFDRVKKTKAEDREHPLGELIALDKQTGEVAWRQKDDIYGTALAVSDRHGILLMSYQATRFRLDSERGGRISAFDTAQGKPIWTIKANYQSRLTLNDDRIYADGGAWQLKTGEPLPFRFKRSYGCGVLSGSRDMVFFRSATLGYFDLKKDTQVKNFGGVRPGCWINAIPAGGLVLVPDASAGCSCSYLNRAWFALEPVE